MLRRFFFFCEAIKTLVQSTSSGAGGIRTHVRTRKSYAFYTLISAFGFRSVARPEPPTTDLSSKSVIKVARPTSTISDLPAPLSLQIRKNILGAVSRCITW